jgi:hypothetical protein
VRQAERVGEMPREGGAAHRVGTDDHQRSRARHRDQRAEERVRALIADEPRRDALVDHVGLLEEQVPGRHRGAHDRDELGGDRQEVEQEQVTHAEPAPEPAEPLVDRPRVPDAGYRAEPDDHLLVDDQHRDEQQQHPQQRRSVFASPG